MATKEKDQELERALMECRALEDRLRELTRRNAEVEERAAVFQREAVAGAQSIADLRHTLRFANEAREKLSAALDRQGIELTRWRQEAAAREAEVRKLESECRRLAVEMERVRESAEDVRREGVEAFEQAQELRKKAAL